MPRRFLGTLVAAFGLALVYGPSAAATEVSFDSQVSFDGEVLRYREHGVSDFRVELWRELPAESPALALLVRVVAFPPADLGPTLHAGPGCHSAAPFLPPNEAPGALIAAVARCPLGSVQDRVRYRFNLSSSVAFLNTYFRGVVYGGPRANDIFDGDRVYGGAGSDGLLQGVRVYGGPGDDSIAGSRIGTDTSVLRGGPGNDSLASPGWLYGGPGADELDDYFTFNFDRTSDMLVGGPGRDTVLLGRDHRSDIVRVRGGGIDRVRCSKQPGTSDVLFVDRADRLTPGCKNAIVLLTERPRYPYP